MGVKGKCNHTWICAKVQGWEDRADTNSEFLQGWMCGTSSAATRAHTRPGNRWEIPSSPARQVPVPLPTLQRREERLCLSSRFCHLTLVFYTPEAVTAYSRQQFGFDQRVFSLPGTGWDFPSLHTQCFHSMSWADLSHLESSVDQSLWCSSCRQRVAKQHSTGFRTKNTEQFKTGVTPGTG